MSLDKAIASGREHRKPYRRAKAVDSTCRNHGSCSYCVENRTYQARRELSRYELRERQSWIDHDNEMAKEEEFYTERESERRKQCQ
jgi:hypothetical protein